MDVQRRLSRWFVQREATSADQIQTRSTTCLLSDAALELQQGPLRQQDNNLATPFRLDTHGYRRFFRACTPTWAAVAGGVGDIDQLVLTPIICLGDLGWLWPPITEVGGAAYVSGHSKLPRLLGMRDIHRGARCLAIAANPSPNWPNPTLGSWHTIGPASPAQGSLKNRDFSCRPSFFATTVGACMLLCNADPNSQHEISPCLT